MVMRLNNCLGGKNNFKITFKKNFQVAKKLATCEADLEKAEDRAEVMIVIGFKRGSLPSIRSITITTLLRWERRKSWS